MQNSTRSSELTLTIERKNAIFVIGQEIITRGLFTIKQQVTADRIQQNGW